MNKVQIFTNGLVKENPVLRLVLGTCPTLAVTTMAFNGLGMGIAATFVLFCSNIAISLLRNVIPPSCRCWSRHSSPSWIPPWACICP